MRIGTVRVRAILLAMALISVSCVGSPDADLKPPPDFVPPPLLPLRKGPPESRLGFGRGFSPMERGPDSRTWHWMGARGEIRLQNDGRPRRLRIAGGLPLEFLKEPPTIRISLGDHLLDTFVARDRTLMKEFSVGSDLLGSAPSVRLVIETSATGRAPGDDRDLGVSIEQVGWQ